MPEALLDEANEPDEATPDEVPEALELVVLEVVVPLDELLVTVDDVLVDAREPPDDEAELIPELAFVVVVGSDVVEPVCEVIEDEKAL